MELGKDNKNESGIRCIFAHEKGVTKVVARD